MKPKLIAHLILGIVVVAFLTEMFSGQPHYELEPCTVRSVVPDARGFIGADEMTLVRFEDGYDTEVAGNRGKQGDKILAYRQRGTETMFGWLGDRSMFKK